MKITRDQANEMIQWVEKYARKGVQLSVGIFRAVENVKDEFRLGLLPDEVLKNPSHYQDQKPFWYFIMEIEDDYKEEG